MHSYEAQIIGIDCEYRTENIYGSLTHGRIKIKSKIANVNFDDKWNLTMPTYELIDEGSRYSILPDISDWSEFEDIDDCYYLLIICTEEHYFQSLVLKQVRTNLNTFGGNCFYKRIGYYDSRPFRDKNGPLLDRIEDKEIILM